MPMRQVLLFFLLAYLISWLIWLPLYGHVFGWEHLKVMPFHHGLGGLGPFAAAVIVTRIFEKDRLGNLLTRCLRIRPFLYFLIALFSPFVLAWLASVMSMLIDDHPADLSALLTNKEFPDFGLLMFFLYNLLFFGFGEETGWRGFALPRLQASMGALTASVVLTVFWALWHLPLFFYRTGYLDMDWAGIAGWVFSLLTGSILLTWLYNSSKGSILVCAVFHTTIDIAFTADFADKRISNYMGFLITLWGALMILVFKPTNLAARKRSKVVEP